MQKLVIRFQILETELKSLQERSQILSEKIDEIEKTREAIKELKIVKQNKALIPLGSGNFISGTIENSEEIMIGIGSGIAIKKKREDAIAILDNRFKEMEGDLNEVTDQTTAIAFELEKIQEQIEKLQK